MTKLINNPFFRSVLIASCMLSGDVPCIIPRPLDNDKLHEPVTSMKVSSDSTSRQSKSSKKKKFKSVVDSGATVHCIRDKSLFTHLDTSKTVRIRVADDRVINSEGVGTCAIKLNSSNGESHTIVLHNCVYSPLFSENLLSTRRLWRDTRISTHMGETNYFKCHNSRNRYYFATDCTHDVEPAARRVNTHESVNILHARFNIVDVIGYVNYSM